MEGIGELRVVIVIVRLRILLCLLLILFPCAAVLVAFVSNKIPALLHHVNHLAIEARKDPASWPILVEYNPLIDLNHFHVIRIFKRSVELLQRWHKKDGDTIELDRRSGKLASDDRVRRGCSCRNGNDAAGCVDLEVVSRLA
jgi:hypothetical protein